MNNNDYQKDFSRDSGKYENDKTGSDSKGFVLGAVIGGVVGAATALMLAPKSGKELRVDLNEGAKSLGEKTEKLRQTATEKTSQLKQTAMEKGSTLAETAKSKTSTLTETVSKQSANLMETVKNKTKKNENKDAVDQVTEPADKGSEGQAKLKLEETEKAFVETENQLNK